MLDTMRDAGHEPNGMTYNTLILDSGNAGELEKAEKALEEMLSKDMHPLMEVYEMLAALAEHKGEQEKAGEYAARRDKIFEAKKAASSEINDEFGLEDPAEAKK